MQKVDLYRYEDENSIITITPNAKSEKYIPGRLRLIADEGMLLTDGKTETSVVDVTFEEESNWEEITDIGAEKMQEAGDSDG